MKKSHASPSISSDINQVKGGETTFTRTNTFTAFTKDTIDWIREVIASHPDFVPPKYGAKESMKKRYTVK